MYYKDIPLKTLYFKESITNIHIDIFKNEVYFYDLISEVINIKSHAEILSGTKVYYDLLTDYDVISNIISLVDYQSLNDEGKKTIEFYKHFDCRNFPALEIATQQKSTDKPLCIAKFNAHGIALKQFNPDGAVLLSQQRISDFFYNGPKIPELPLAVRLDYKNKIIHHLNGLNSTFNEKGYKLLDYDKIPEKSYTENFNDDFQQTIVLTKSGILKKYKSKKNEWAVTYSHEDFRQNWSQLAEGWSESVIYEINTLIDAASVE